MPDEPYIHPGYRMPCDAHLDGCPGYLDTRAFDTGYRVIGLDVKRHGGGANTITLKEPILDDKGRRIYLCSWCIKMLEDRHSSQPGLFD